MREEIRGLQQRLGLTVAYVTHDQSEALAVSDQIIVMDQGLIAQSGPPNDLYERPKTEFVAAFMGETMLFPATVDEARTVRVGPLSFQTLHALPKGKVKVAVRPEAWIIGSAGSGMEGRLKKAAYLGSSYEYTFETELGPIFVVSPNLASVVPLDATVGLELADHGISVVLADGTNL